MAPAAATGNQDVRPQVSVRAVPAPDMPCPPHAPRKPRTTCPLPLLHFLPALGAVHLLQSWAQGLLGPPPSTACRQHPCSGLVIHPQLNVMLIGAKKPPRGQGLGSACFLDRSTASLPAGALHGRVGVTGHLLGSCPQPGPFTRRHGCWLRPGLGEALRW